MPELTSHDLERFSDAAGRLMAETDGHNIPTAGRHIARFAELVARHQRARVFMSVSAHGSGSFMPCRAIALPQR